MMFKIILPLFLFLASHTTLRAQVVINELMQSNIDCVMDDLNEFPDSWVELYNAGESYVNLSSYYLGDTDNPDEAWQLPAQLLGAKQYVLIYCDKEATGAHTPFRLDSGKGGAVYLFQSRTIIDKVTGIKKQPAPNIAYGRVTDASSSWGYQLTPTPGSANCGQVTNKILGEPIFSTKGRVRLSAVAQTLTLSIPEGSPAGTVIRYTTDGSEPTVNSTLYSAPLTLSNTTVIRAKLFCEGWLSPRSTTHSYIRFSRNLTLPVISIVTNDSYLNDEKIGIYVDGTYNSSKKNYEYDWRRPINFEYFEQADAESCLNQLCETRIMGGATRNSKFKSLAVYANKRFGTKRFEYEFFPDQRPGIKDFKSIALRNAGNDFDYLYMRDAIIQRSMAKYVDLDWQSWRPAIIYINGQYKGLLNIRDRSNEDNIYTYYGGLEDIDMFENWNELKEGTWDNYNAFKEFYAEHGHTMAEYEQWMDCREFINLMIMNLYYNNQDFPGNNIVMWRPRTEGGRWRWIAKDTDFGLGLYGSSADYKTLEWLYNPNYDYNRNWANQYEHTRLFRRLMEDADFQREFIDRTAIYMGDFLNEKGVRAVWDPMYDVIKAEYPYHRNLINQWWPKYDEELASARKWLSQRTNIFYQQVADYYHLGKPISLQVNPSLSEEQLRGLTLCFNDVTLSGGQFDGKFFDERTVTLSASAEGRTVTGWEIIQTADDGTQTITQIEGSTCTFNMPTCNNLVVNTLISDASGINSEESAACLWSIKGNSMILSSVPAGTRVSLYNLQGHLLYQQSATGRQLSIPLTPAPLHIVKVGSQTFKIRR